jgi:hypothetical protein
MNRTLFDCGVKKTMEARNCQLFDVTATLPRTVELPSKPTKCDFCNESFAVKKYIDTHVRFKHFDKVDCKSSTHIPVSKVDRINVSDREFIQEDDELLPIERNLEQQTNTEKPND